MPNNYTYEEEQYPCNKEMFINLLDDNFALLNDKELFTSLKEFLQNDFDNEVKKIDSIYSKHPKKILNLRENTLNKFIRLLIEGTPDYLVTTDWYNNTRNIVIDKILEINNRCSVKINFNEMLDKNDWILNQDQIERWESFKKVLITRKNITTSLSSNTVNSNSSRTSRNLNSFPAPVLVQNQSQQIQLLRPNQDFQLQPLNQNLHAKQYKHVEGRISNSKAPDNASLSSISLCSERRNYFTQNNIHEKVPIDPSRSNNVLETFPNSTHKGTFNGYPSDNLSKKSSFKNSDEPNSTEVLHYKSSKIKKLTKKIKKYKKKIKICMEKLEEENLRIKNKRSDSEFYSSSDSESGGE